MYNINKNNFHNNNNAYNKEPDVIDDAELYEEVKKKPAKKTPIIPLFNYIPTRLIPDDKVRKRFTCPGTDHLIHNPLQDRDGNRTCRACVITKVYKDCGEDINNPEKPQQEQLNKITTALTPLFPDRSSQKELEAELAKIPLAPVKCLHEDCNFSFSESNTPNEPKKITVADLVMHLEASHLSNQHLIPTWQPKVANLFAEEVTLQPENDGAQIFFLSNALIDSYGIELVEQGLEPILKDIIWFRQQANLSERDIKHFVQNEKQSLYQMIAIRCTKEDERQEVRQAIFGSTALKDTALKDTALKDTALKDRAERA